MGLSLFRSFPPPPPPPPSPPPLLLFPLQYLPRTSLLFRTQAPSLSCPKVERNIKIILQYFLRSRETHRQNKKYTARGACFTDVEQYIEPPSAFKRPASLPLLLTLAPSEYFSGPSLPPCNFSPFYLWILPVTSEPWPLPALNQESTLP